MKNQKKYLTNAKNEPIYSDIMLNDNDFMLVTICGMGLKSATQGLSTKELYKLAVEKGGLKPEYVPIKYLTEDTSRSVSPSDSETKESDLAGEDSSI
jgi:hypothetical protein